MKVEIQLSKSPQKVIIDKEDLKLFEGKKLNLHSTGRVVCHYKGKVQYIARIIMGVEENHLWVKYKDSNYLNCSKDNLYILDRNTTAKTWRDTNLRRTYGITESEYDQLFLEQNNQCLLCGKNPEEWSKDAYVGAGPGNRPVKHRKFCVDHCHDTGKIRGILCWNCNNGLGQFKDNPEVLRKAADYIEINVKLVSRIGKTGSQN